MNQSVLDITSKSIIIIRDAYFNENSTYLMDDYNNENMLDEINEDKINEDKINKDKINENQN
ncbi:hypothetical protein U3516DRAFT_768348 [Neocallimastix sp. 'constans']